MIVIDASVLTNALTDDGPVGERARDELAADAHWAAPEHLIVEVFSAVRGLWLGQKIASRRAEDALVALASTTIGWVTTAPLLERMWELRSNVSGYDAAYLAAAETFGCVLVTADARLAAVPGLRCEVRVALPHLPSQDEANGGQR